MSVQNDKLEQKLDEQTELSQEHKNMDYLGSVLYLSEDKIELNFASEMKSEFSVVNLLEFCGFSTSMVGSRYITRILYQCVSQSHIPETVKGLYEIAATYFNTKPHNVESAIRVAIKFAAKRKLLNINNLFNCNYVDEYITNGDFLNFVANRLILLKKYNEKIVYN